MSFHIYRCIFSSVVAFSLSLAAFGQSLPALKNASEIAVSSLPNGISCYLVTNKAAKGSVDMALVQKGRSMDFQSREAVSVVQHSTSYPCEFLARHGVGYSVDGVIEDKPGAVAYRFINVPVDNQTVVDSTLLMVFDIASTYDKSQALIISGDINPTTLRDRLGVFSLAVSKRGRTAAGKPYEWNPADSLETHVNSFAGKSAATITFRSLSPRVPQEAMNTSQPLVSRLFAEELGSIIGRRIEFVFRRNGIPVSDLSFRYITSDDIAGDESFIIRLSTHADMVQTATEKLASILADLDVNGFSEEEFNDARQRSICKASKASSSDIISNAEYVDRCISSYLFGSTLVAHTTINRFIVGRSIPASREAELLQKFTSGMLDSSCGTCLSFELPSEYMPGAGELPLAFKDAWKQRAANGVPIKMSGAASAYSDTLGQRAVPEKVRFRSSSSEPVTGGSIWTFTNGMKVIYKKVASTGRFDYAFVLRGGVPKVDSLKAGESAFVADMLLLNRIGGASGNDFKHMLENNGVTMNVNADLSSLNIKGCAPKDKAEFLVRSLLSLAYGRTPDEEAFSLYCKEESVREELLRTSAQSLHNVMDSIICPDFYYPERKNAAAIGEKLPERAGRYFDSQFAKANDGVLIFIGDLDENELKKMLCSTLGYFQTSKQFSLRDQVTYQMRSGWSTYSVDGAGVNEPSVSVSMSALSTFSVASHMTFRLAYHALRMQMIEAMYPYGMSVKVTGRYDIFPVEKYSLEVTCRPCASSSLPAEVEPADLFSALGAMRTAIAGLREKGVSEAVLKRLKTIVSNEMAAQMNRPDKMVDAAIMRYAEGKDAVTGYADALKKVKASDVSAILSSLDSGSKVEYIIK